jgi:hypothetical protein
MEIASLTVCPVACHTLGIATRPLKMLVHFLLLDHDVRIGLPSNIGPCSNKLRQNPPRFQVLAAPLVVPNVSPQGQICLKSLGAIV